MIGFTGGLFNGCGLLLEHIEGDEEEGIEWIVVLSVLFFRFAVYKAME